VTDQSSNKLFLEIKPKEPQCGQVCLRCGTKINIFFWGADEYFHKKRQKNIK
jgi:hypothetical protein